MSSDIEKKRSEFREKLQIFLTKVEDFKKKQIVKKKNKNEQIKKFVKTVVLQKQLRMSMNIDENNDENIEL